MDRDEASQRAEAFAEHLLALAEAPDELTKADLQEEAFELAVQWLESEADLTPLYALAPRFDEVGLFAGSDWDRPSKLQPGLVELTVQSREGVGIECCSQLRFLAIAQGDLTHPRVAPEEARKFLERVLALNLRSLFALTREGEHGEEALQGPVRRLFEEIIDALGVEGVMTSLVQQAERILLTRPIKIKRVRRMVESAAEGIARWGYSEVGREAALLYDALFGPTTLSRACVSLEEYASALTEMDDPGLLLEADTMSTYMRRTGLVSRQHAALVRFANEAAADGDTRLLARALGLEEVGRVTLAEHRELLCSLIDEAVTPATAQCIYGFSQLLERGVLFQAAVPAGLRTLKMIRVAPDVAEELVAGADAADPPPARALLIAGALSVLGTPRGVDQGHNPTCQSARAISLWAQIDPGYLLTLVVRAARGQGLVMEFEGEAIDSRDVARGVADEYHPELDIISLLLTPHLDKIYWEMSRRAGDRDEDEHKWVNPAFHGWWVHRGFAAAIDEYTGHVRDADEFVRRFYASYHPRFNGGRPVMIPQPCGVATTNSAGNFLDWHAVSIQRVEEDREGDLRVYFFNPNHDKGQDWGRGVVTSTSDHGELMGESSLPFEQLASRLYVFHYEPTETGPLDEVPAAEVRRVLTKMRKSWAKGLEWDGLESGPASTGRRIARAERTDPGARVNRATLIYDDAMLGHAPDGYDPNRPEWTALIKERLGDLDEGGTRFSHPERPERLRAILESLDDDPIEGIERMRAAPAGRETKLLAHSEAHVDYVESFRGRSGWLNEDTTAVSEESCHAADVAVGAATSAVDVVLAEEGPSQAFAVVRPPGHHAGPDGPEGFCLYNNVAIATIHAQERRGVERVLVVDWDAHHGNGTQAILRDRKGVLHFDVHAEAPVYPGTGPLFDTGRSGGLINVPLPPKSGDSAFLEAFDTILRPAAERFLPDLVIVSAGFDAHPSDLLMNVSEAGFAAMTQRLMDIADRWCEGRLALVLEGGYREALSRSVHATLRTLTTGEAPRLGRSEDDDPGRHAVITANRFHSRPVYAR